MNKAVHIPITPYRHRSWNHVCWAYDSHNQCHSIFYNGVDVGQECDDSASIKKWTREYNPQAFEVEIHSNMYTKAAKILHKKPEILTAKYGKEVSDALSYT